MSTRATITVRDERDSFTIYRHSAGYPGTAHGVLATLSDALPYAWKLPRFEAADFAAAIIAAWKKPARMIADIYPMQGGSIYLTTSAEAHGDTEYHYDVSQDAKGRVIVQTFIASYGADGTRVWDKMHRGGKHVIG